MKDFPRWLRALSRESPTEIVDLTHGIQLRGRPLEEAITEFLIANNQTEKAREVFIHIRGQQDIDRRQRRP